MDSLKNRDYKVTKMNPYTVLKFAGDGDDDDVTLNCRWITMYLGILVLSCAVFNLVHVNGSKKHHVISACNKMFLFHLAIDDDRFLKWRKYYKWAGNL